MQPNLLSSDLENHISSAAYSSLYSIQLVTLENKSPVSVDGNCTITYTTGTIDTILSLLYVTLFPFKVAVKEKLHINS